MKRSEIIMHIANVLKLTGNHYCEDGRDVDDAEKILKRIESLGMLPPKPKRKITLYNYFYQQGERTLETGFSSDTWEYHGLNKRKLLLTETKEIEVGNE